MKAGPWPIPVRLQSLIAIGFWPADGRESLKQNLKSLVARERVGKFAPEEEAIYFYAPPFSTISELIAGGEDFWTKIYANPGGISPEYCVPIMDFGLGSDAPVILDYSGNPARPEVKRLEWGKTFAENRWVAAAADFDEMCEILGLPCPP